MPLPTLVPVTTGNSGAVRRRLPPVVITAMDLKCVRQHHDAGRHRQALLMAQKCGELHRWVGAEPTALAGEICQEMGAPRLGRWLHLRGYRSNRANDRTRVCFVRAIFQSRGPFAAWQLLRAWQKPGQLGGEHPVEYLILQARIAAGMRDFDTARTWLAQAEKAGAEPYRVWVERAYLFEKVDLYKETLQAAERSLQLKPWNAPGVLATAHALQLASRDQDALALLREARDKVECVPLFIRLATLELNLEQFEQAGATLENLRQYSPIIEKPLQDWIAAQRIQAASRCGNYTLATDLAEQQDKPEFKLMAETLAKNDASARRVRLPVEFVRQHDVTCVPATLTALGRFWKRPVDHLEVADAICYNGTSSQSQRKWAEENGWKCRDFTVDWESAVALLDRGIPFALTTTAIGMGHLQAISGYDAGDGSLRIRDPYYYYPQDVFAKTFLARYRSSGPEGFVMVPPEQESVLNEIKLTDAEARDLTYRIELALEKHQREEAAKLLDEMDARWPGHFLTLMARLSLAGYDQNSQAMLETVERLLDLFPDDDWLRHRKVMCLFEQNDHETRLQYLGRICSEPASNPVFWQIYGSALSADPERSAESGYWLRRALRQQPNNTSGFHELAARLWQEHEVQEALALYRFAACSSDKDERAASQYFARAHESHQGEAALEFLKSRFQRYLTKAAGPAITLAEAHATLGQLAQGWTILETARKARPNDGEILVTISQWHGRQGAQEDARRTLEQARPFVTTITAHRVNAQLAGIRKDYTAARDHWKQVLALSPLDVDAQHSYTGILEVLEGRAAALKHIESLCEKFPHHFGLHSLWSRWLSIEGPQAAKPVLEKMVVLNPTDVSVRLRLAQLNLDLGDIAVAEKHVEAAIKLDREHPSGHLMKAWIHRMKGQLADAQLAYREALAKDAELAPAMYGLMACSQTLLEQRTAVLYVQTQLLKRMRDGSGLATFGRIAAGILSENELMNVLRQVHREHPHLWAAWSNLIHQLALQGDLDAARHLAKEAVAKFPSSSNAWHGLAWLYRVSGDHLSEIDTLQQWRDLEPGNQAIFVSLAQACRRSGQAERSLDYLHQALALAPNDPVTLEGLAAHYHSEKNHEQAMEYARKALRQNDDLGLALDIFVESCQSLKQPEKSLELAREFTVATPGDSLAWLRVARMLREPAQRAERDAAIDRAIALHPRCIPAYELRADLLAAEDKNAEAIAACRAPIWGGVPPVELQLKVIFITYDMGKIDDAIVALNKLIADQPGEFRARAMLVECLFEKKQYDRIQSLAMEMRRLQPESAAPLLILGRLKLLEKDQPGAIELFEKAVRTDPQNAGAVITLLRMQLQSNQMGALQETFNHLEALGLWDWLIAGHIFLATRRDDAQTMQDLLKKLTEIERPDASAWNMALDAIVETGWVQVALPVIEAQAKLPNASAYMGGVWMHLCDAANKWPPEAVLNKLATQSEAGKAAVIEYLRIKCEAHLENQKKQNFFSRWMGGKELQNLFKANRGWIEKHPLGKTVIELVGKCA